MLNSLEIRIQTGSWDGGERYREIRLFIDGRDLIDRLREYELPLAIHEGAASVAGKYAGLCAAHTSRKRFLGCCDLDYGADGEKVSLLECQCGCEGCWPLACRITVSETTVRWSDFEQPHRRKDSPAGWWDYSGFGPFEFERGPYEAELMKIEGSC